MEPGSDAIRLEEPHGGGECRRVEVEEERDCEVALEISMPSGDSTGALAVTRTTQGSLRSAAQKRVVISSRSASWELSERPKVIWRALVNSAVRRLEGLDGVEVLREQVKYIRIEPEAEEDDEQAGNKQQRHDRENSGALVRDEMGDGAVETHALNSEVLTVNVEDEAVAIGEYGGDLAGGARDGRAAGVPPEKT